ncbi:MAG: single-stranded DNA-binding protein [candidate division FCPU426 bacterium]
MASLNRVIIVGNLTKDPELKFIPSGQAVCNLRMATNRKWKAANGEWKDEVTYVSVVVWGKSAEACGEYLKKGSPALVEGRLQSRQWETDKGEKRSILEVVAERVQFLGAGRREGGATGGSDFENSTPPPVESAGGGDDDIPF